MGTVYIFRQPVAGASGRSRKYILSPFLDWRVAMIEVATDVSGDWDSSADWPALAADAVRATVAASAHSALARSAITIEVSVKFASVAEVKALNLA